MYSCFKSHSCCYSVFRGKSTICYFALGKFKTIMTNYYRNQRPDDVANYMLIVECGYETCINQGMCE